MERKEETIAKEFRIALFGKDGCEKCKSLKKRLDKILANKPYEKFDLKYYNLNTMKGLIAYAKAETVNGQRLPSLQVMKLDRSAEVYRKIEDPREETFRDGQIFVPTYLQLETDYTNQKKAVIKPASIKELLSIALQN